MATSYIKLEGGKLYDPINGINGVKRDLYIQDGRIVATRTNGKLKQCYNLNGKIVMPGGIDIHTHIGGGKTTIARTMLPEDQRANPSPRTPLTRSGGGHIMPSTLTTGYRYAEMGYTACFEPAMLPVNARQTHMEMADTPMVDKGAYALLGNDDFLMRMLAQKKSQTEINDYVAWVIHATHAMAIKVVNPGGINAFKFNQRRLDLDELNTYYGISPRKILHALTQAITDLKLPHPLHVHGCNLGIPGNATTTLNTIQATEGRRLHLTHVQFHSYGEATDNPFSSGAAEIAEAVNQNPNISIDVGQILFGQTVTVSGDTMMQYAGHQHAHPKKWLIMDIECEAGCGVVPFKYKNKSLVNALQWIIGLELFLMVDDPWRIFLTTDHPNGAPFTSYPHLIRLLMDKSFRNDMLTTLNQSAVQNSILAATTREYSLYEIAIVTRAGPAVSLGLKERGHLGAGAIADIAVYTEHKNKERMFSQPDYVFKNGQLIVKKGKITKVVNGGTHIVQPEFDRSIERPLKGYFNRYQTVSLENYKLNDEEIINEGKGHIITHPCNTS